MAHPIIEALYIGLLTSGLSQPIDAPKTVVSVPKPAGVIAMPGRQRVVYDWATGERLVFDVSATTPPMTSQPAIGITEEQVDRMIDASAS